MKRKILGLTLALVLSTVAITGCTTGSSVGTAKDGNEVAIETAAIKLVSAVADGGYSLVSTKELNGWITEGKDMIIIDTMPNDFYSKGHIPTALNAVLPKGTLDEATEEEKQAFISILGEDKSRTIVIYCGFTACGRSHVGASLAKELGYENVYRLPGGIISWQDAKYEVEK